MCAKNSSAFELSRVEANVFKYYSVSKKSFPRLKITQNSLIYCLFNQDSLF